MNRLLEIIRNAGKIMLRAHDIEDSVKEKTGSANFVTEYDVKVQDYLYEQLRLYWPDAVMIGEESVANDYQKALNGSCFVIDPIDGTTNFIYGYRHSAISVALCRNLKPVMAAVYNPYTDELFYAQQGGGAFLNETKLQVTNNALDASISGFGTSPYYREYWDLTFRIAKTMMEQGRDLRRTGSAALDLAYLAAGRIDLFFECKLSPWDYAAGMLLIQEAGGVCSTLTGTVLTLEKTHSVLCGNQWNHPEFLKKIHGLIDQELD